MFTGDRSGDFLYAALHRTGFANQPHSIRPGDGLELDGVWITSPVKCEQPANKPFPLEAETCATFLEPDLTLLTEVTVFVPLGQVGLDAAWRFLGCLPCSTLDVRRVG